MFELVYHKRNHLITTVTDGDIFTSNHMFERAIWDILPQCIFEKFEILKFSKITRVIYTKNGPKQKSGYWLITPNTLHRN